MNFDLILAFSQRCFGGVLPGALPQATVIPGRWPGEDRHRFWPVGCCPMRSVVQRVAGFVEKSKNPSLTLLDVALSGMGLDGSVGGVTS